VEKKLFLKTQEEYFNSLLGIAHTYVYPLYPLTGAGVKKGVDFNIVTVDILNTQ
jgi:hypothetical protein